MKIFLEQKNKSGFTLIEALVVLFIFSLITTTFYSVFSLGGSYIIESKNRLGAISLANEKMEIIRNLQYDDIGISGGIPDGNIVAEEDVFENKHTYHVKTLIQYVDDEFDGVYPGDLASNDYKRAKVTVSWAGPRGQESNLFLTAMFVPPGMEQSVSGGTLAINIIGSDGIGVPQASVHITNSSISPAVDMTIKTNNDGNILLPGAEYSIGGYRMEISKDNYETVTTIGEDSVEYSVIDVPASVVEGMLNIKSIVQDKTMDMEIFSEDVHGVVLPEVGFDLEGGRILGNDMLASPIAPVYNVNSAYVTDSSGQKTLENLSPGQYFVSDVMEPNGYVFVGLDNFSNFDILGGKYSILTEPGEEKNFKIKFASTEENGLFLKIFEVANNERVGGAQVTLSNADGYSEVVTTMDDGVAIFSPVPTVGEYNLEIVTAGYVNYTEVIAIEGLVEKQMGLTAGE